ncbi:MAG: ABC transporter substrate-binding protein [Reyranella sp.]|jgi:putative spermidine/putrescine transport system substrate-binding protein|nr:ABC transporter substrate-binding protein [Reyranella sp.]MBL6651864.1 ABC transporter substrate-binding protein [Reyranella sp.]
MKKRLVPMAFGLAVVVAAGGAAAESLVVAGYASSFEKVMREKVIPDFEREQGVSVQYAGGNSTDNLAKLVAQRGNQQVDVAMMDDGPIVQAIALGLCALIEGLDKSALQPMALFPEGKGVGMGMVATGLMYNRKVFAERGWAPPDSWTALEDPKFARRIVMPPMSNGYGLLATVMLARIGGGGESNIDPGFAAMKRVAGNVVAFEPSPARMTELFQTDQAVLSVWGSARYQAFADTGFPVDFVYPREGAPALLTGICPVAKKAVSPKAQAFIATMLSAKVQKIMAEEGGYAPVRKGVEIATAGGVMPVGARVSHLVSVDWSVINPLRNEWTKRWNREIER